MPRRPVNPRFRSRILWLWSAAACTLAVYISLLVVVRID